MKINLEEVKTFIENQSLDSKIYLGCDSSRFLSKGVWYADYVLAIVVHIDGKHGCKLFGEVQTERDYDQKKDKPKIRLMNETIKIANLYLKLVDIIEDRNVEIHLDLNPDEKYGSYCAVSEAIGYIRGVCNVIPLIKPNAWCASYAADRFKSLKII